MIEWHRRGTRYGIGVDPADGLLKAGAEGVQLTWMDAKVGDWVVTPRMASRSRSMRFGIIALRIMSALRPDSKAGQLQHAAQAGERSFAGSCARTARACTT